MTVEDLRTARSASRHRRARSRRGSLANLRLNADARRPHRRHHQHRAAGASPDADEDSTPRSAVHQRRRRGVSARAAPLDRQGGALEPATPRPRPTLTVKPIQTAHARAKPFADITAWCSAPTRRSSRVIAGLRRRHRRRTSQPAGFGRTSCPRAASRTRHVHDPQLHHGDATPQDTAGILALSATVRCRAVEPARHAGRSSFTLRRPGAAEFDRDHQCPERDRRRRDTLCIRSRPPARRRRRIRRPRR